MPRDGANGRKDALDRRGRGGGTLRGRLLFAALVSIAPLLVGAGLWITMLSHSAADYRQRASGAGRESASSVRLLQLMNRAEDAGIDYMRSGRGADLQAFRADAAKVDPYVRELVDE